MLGSDHEERRAEQRVGARGEDRLGSRSSSSTRKRICCALGTADPVALDRLRALGPLAAGRQVVLEQLVRVGGRLEEPLRHVPQSRRARRSARSGRATMYSFAITVWSFGHQLTGASLAVGEPVLEELQEQPLRPAVETRVRATRPRGSQSIAQPRRFICARMVAMFRSVISRGWPPSRDGGVLRRQSEGRPSPSGARRSQPLRRRTCVIYVAHRVVEDVAHVHAVAGRVRQHLELGPQCRSSTGCPGSGFGTWKACCVLPDALPLRPRSPAVRTGPSASRYEKASRERGRGSSARLSPRGSPCAR